MGLAQALKIGGLADGRVQECAVCGWLLQCVTECLVGAKALNVFGMVHCQG